MFRITCKRNKQLTQAIHSSSPATNTKRLKQSFRKQNARLLIHNGQMLNMPSERKYVLGPSKGHRTLNIISLNPDSLNDERLNDTIIQMERRKTHIAGVQETHITRNLTRTLPNGYYLITSAATANLRNKKTPHFTPIGGVAIILEPDLAKFVTTIQPISNRILLITLDSLNTPCPVTVLVTYAPHNGYSNHEKKNLLETSK